MLETKKTLIVVYKDELLMNQLKKMIETHDDAENEVVGTRDNSINVVSWTEKVWLGNKKAGNIQGKILFLGDIKGTDKLIPVIDVKFDDCGVKYGWAGNQAVLYVEPEALTSREGYDEFLKKLSDLPVPNFLKTMKQDIVENAGEEPVVEIAKQEETDGEKEAPAFLNVAKKILDSGADAFEKVSEQVAVKSEEIFRNKSLMKRQMLFYGAIHLYRDELESFMNK
ncbi:hypothetical protein [Lancefieldella parvula]|jgi:50S ribosomal protein L31 type B|uniref:hypothetical protein n=1 Tax=Lancefieldella parvula TaxID=1382 RepID=UPI0028D640C2|nr:hypothetical protein [Lancefieldella parvula]